MEPNVIHILVITVLWISITTELVLEIFLPLRGGQAAVVLCTGYQFDAIYLITIYEVSFKINVMKNHV